MTPETQRTKMLRKWNREAKNRGLGCYEDRFRTDEGWRAARKAKGFTENSFYEHFGRSGLEDLAMARTRSAQEY